MRLLQQRKLSDVSNCKDLPDEIPLPLIIGTKVTGEMSYTKCRDEHKQREKFPFALINKSMLVLLAFILTPALPFLSRQLDFEVSTMGCSQDRLMQWTPLLPLTASPSTAVAWGHTLCLTTKFW